MAGLSAGTSAAGREEIADLADPGSAKRATENGERKNHPSESVPRVVFESKEK
jgi:hypothetical protein